MTEFYNQSAKLVVDGVLQDVEFDDLKCVSFSLNGNVLTAPIESKVATPAVVANPGFANVSVDPFYWQRIGNVVSFSGSFNADYGGVTVHELELTPPAGFTSNFVVATDCCGVAVLASDWKDTSRLDVQAEPTDNTIIVYVTLASNSSDTNQDFNISGHYRVL